MARADLPPGIQAEPIFATVPAPESTQPNAARWFGDVMIGLALLGTAYLFWWGVTNPAIEVTAFFFSKAQVSIADGIRDFYANGQPALATFILVVSVIFPLLKIGSSLLLLIFMRQPGPGMLFTLWLLAFLSRFSMTDVFVLAVTVLVIDGRVLSTASLLPAAFVYGAAVVCSMVVTAILHWREKRRYERSRYGAVGVP